jgi:ribose 5-phosphate isomerase
MRETTLNRGHGATNFMKERLNVNIGVRKVRCPHNFCKDCCYIRCPTLTKARQIIQNTTFTDPNNYILHCGTNDIEHLQPEQNLDKAIENIVGLVKE